MIQFVKAHACGNDFLIVETKTVPVEKQREAAIHLCERNQSVGADGVEYLEWSGEKSGKIRLVNADGSIAEISGNGTRCVAAWMAHTRKLGAGDVITLETDAGQRECRVVQVDGHLYHLASRMGVPTHVERSVKLADGVLAEGIAVSTGNPHFVIFADNADFMVHGRSWQEIGREICFHPDFPEQTNVEFVRTVSKDEIEIRIFERGVGPTTSSGTGTCATATATIAYRGGATRLRVNAPGGEQCVEWHGGEDEILLTGPAALIATGEAFGC